MKYLSLGIAFALLATGCRKHDEGTPVGMGGTMPGVPSGVITKYNGAVIVLTGCFQSCTQTVTVNADVTDFPSDVVSVYLCKNTVCSVDNLPSAKCSQTVFSPLAACYTTRPSPNITLGKNSVGFVMAGNTPGQAGYTSYAIETIINR